MVNSVITDYKFYQDEFLKYHIYTLLRSKLKNDRLRKLFSPVTTKGTVVYLRSAECSEYSKEEFIERISEYIYKDKVDSEFLNQTICTLNHKFSQQLVEFVQYATLINELNTDDSSDIPLNRLAEINCIDDSIIEEPLRNATDILVSSILDIISIRQKIKNSIQQYSIIRDKKGSS